MSKQEDTTTEVTEPTRCWQYGLKHLLLVPVAVGLSLAFFIALCLFPLLFFRVLVLS
jgi:hypothetical protein